MRIKKYQKIICLGLALLSIMVLPCSANDNDISSDIEILRYVYNESTGQYTNYNLISEVIEEFNINLPDYLGLKYNKTLYDDNYNSTPNNYIALSTNVDSLYIGILRLDNNDNLYIMDFTHNKFASVIYNTNIFDLEGNNVYFRIFKIDINTQYEDNLYYCRFGVISNSNLGFYNNYVVFSKVNEAVLNITTYTNLLIQNFGKAFSFITGPALAWVLLGISVSLISFGIYSAKRFL